ncbi:MAG: DUF433 domain-containing protein [Pirellulales bacterium]
MKSASIDHIEFRKNRAGQDRAYIAGTRVRVQDIYVDSEVLGKTPEEIVTALPQLSLAQVHAALAYYFDHRAQIVEELRQDEQFTAAMKERTGPGPLEKKLRQAGDGDAISSG